MKLNNNQLRHILKVQNWFIQRFDYSKFTALNKAKEHFELILNSNIKQCQQKKIPPINNPTVNYFSSIVVYLSEKIDNKKDSQLCESLTQSTTFSCIQTNLNF